MKRKSKKKENQEEGEGEGVERSECKENGMCSFVYPLPSDDSFLCRRSSAQKDEEVAKAGPADKLTLRVFLLFSLHN